MATQTIDHPAKQALALLVNAIVETVVEAGPAGAPASSIFLALNARGVSYAMFSAIMSALVETGKIRHANNTYFAN